MISLPEDVKYLLNTLKNNGYKAYVVGGCVRDTLLGKNPKDWDITTDAIPRVVNSYFDNTIEVGRRFGTVKVLLNDNDYEITTFRRDGEYNDSRRPDKVFFSKEIKDDLRRRDFTINAMAYNPETGLIDLFDGRKHLIQQKIMCVGNAGERFCEDALRILRGIRFASQFQFKVEQKTYEAMIKNKERLNDISAERIQQELNKILLSSKPSVGISLADQTGILKTLFPGCKENLCKEEDFKRIDSLEPDLLLRLTGILQLLTNDANIHSMETSRTILKRLKYDRKTVARADSLLNAWARISNVDSSLELKGLIREVGKEDTSLLLKLYEAEPYNKRHAFFLKELYEGILDRAEPIDYQDLNISGKDLIQEGFRGREIRETIEMLINTVHNNPDKNKKEVLLELIKNMKNR